MDPQEYQTDEDFAVNSGRDGETVGRVNGSHSESQRGVKESVSKVAGKIMLAGVHMLEKFPGARGVPEKIWRSGFNRLADTATGVLRKRMLRDRPIVLDSTMEVAVEKNPDRRSYFDIIGNAVQKYQGRGGEVHWCRDPEYVDQKVVMDLLSKKITKEDLDHLYGAGVEPTKSLREGIPVVQAITETFGGKNGYYSSIGIIQTLLPLRSREAIIASHPEGEYFVDQPDQGYSIEGLFREYRAWIVEQSQKLIDAGEQGFVLTEDVLVKFLEDFNGDMGEALAKMSSFLKYLARENYRDEGELIYVDSGIVSSRILDEYSELTPYNLLPYQEHPSITESGEPSRLRTFPSMPGQDIHDYFLGLGFSVNRLPNYEYSRFNQEGKPYHAANIVALLPHFSPEIIFFMVGAEYAVFGSQHGLSKLISDVRVLADLKRIDNFLMTYSSPHGGTSSAL